MHCACKNITKRLRQIRNAWHSQFKLSFVFTVQWIRLSGSVAHYLTRRYTKWRNQTMEKVDWHKNDIDDGTVITDSYKTTQNVRRYFKSKFGEQFKFDRDFMQWMKNSVGLTMGDASKEWMRRQDSK